MRIIRLAALSTAGALLLGACGDDGGSDSASSGSGPDLVSSGKLTVCSDIPYEPFEFEDDNGEQTGFDIDLVRAMADKIDLDLEVKDLPFDGILGALAAGDCDMIASAMTITDERAEQVDFTDPYFDADQSLLVKVENEQKFATLDDLAGQTIGVQSGTTGETYAKENKPEGATVKEFEDAAGLFGALESDTIEAVLQDFPVNAYRATQDDTVVVTETFPTGEQYGFAVAKGNDGVLTMINDGLADLRDDGTYDDIFAKCFGEAPAESDSGGTTTTAG